MRLVNKRRRSKSLSAAEAGQHGEAGAVTGTKRRKSVPIGEVIGHKEMGLALVQWSDAGLRPIGTKLYEVSQAKRKNREPR